ncbi:hypothetical protein C0431_01430 [bacterium]|nr:hypothetical protein [bacterium]
MTGWLAEQGRIYFRNANSVKDYRIQLRSTKTAWYWAIYLGVLVLVAISNYGAIENSAWNRSASGVQSSLTTYYQIVSGFIHAAILLIAPMLAASAIVSEYELQSMDLVKCSPTSSKYFFVGKYLAVMRQVGLLLFLALPIAAVGVTLGGATWAEIFEQFGYMYMQAGLATAIAVPLAVSTKTVIRTVFGYFGVMFGFSFLLMILALLSMGAGFTVVPPFVGLIPFASAFSVGKSLPIFGVEIPNWVSAGILTTIFVKVLLLGAGSAMTRAGSKETLSLRLHGLLLVGLLSAIIGWSYGSLPPMPTGQTERLTALFVALCLPAYLVVGLALAVAAHGRTEERKFFADRLFVLQDTWRGRPSGAIGFLLIATMMMAAASILPFELMGRIRNLEIALSVGWILSFVMFSFALVWLVSTSFDDAVASRRAVTGFGFLIGASPMALGVALQYLWNTLDVPWGLRLNPFIPYAETYVMMGVKTLVLMVLGVLLLWWGEKRRKKNLDVMRSRGQKVDRDEIVGSAT